MQVPISSSKMHLKLKKNSMKSLMGQESVYVYKN